MTKICLVILSYLMGCFTAGYYLVRFETGQDIRTMASGNVGSRNVGRMLGARGFMLTFICDAGKGLLAVWLARQVSSEGWFGTAVLIAVTAGHLWPVQLRFRGGKGIATFAGGMILLQPLVLLVCLVFCALLYPLVRRTTITALIVLGFSPLFMAAVPFYQKIPLHAAQLLLYGLLVAMILYAHRSNIHTEFCRNSTAGE
jgi:acyl phosphate:glycerol-3-phosphate acyltransferase